jgi:hypothetical protein
MCDGFKQPVEVNEYGLAVEALRCVNCGRYDFLKKPEIEVPKCFRHQIKYCGICERVANRKLVGGK